MKFVLFVEGHTEKVALPAFFQRWLNPQLNRRVGFKVVRFEGWRDYVNEIGKKVALNLSGMAGADVIAAIGLLDLYGPTVYKSESTTVAKRYEWAKQDIERKASNPRFRQYFAVHETEAWLLADPTILPGEVRAALPGRSAEPETVNFNEPPSDLLRRLYREKLHEPYKKVTDGSNLFEALSPAVAHRKCPYLRQLLEDMLMLAREASP